MKENRASTSAQAVAFARGHLTSVGVVRDPLARSMLPGGWRLAETIVRQPPFRFLGRSATMSFLAARTLFFDDAVLHGIDDGASQVVTIGAGYDSRAWRLARDGVTFYEVDHPATQRHKRALAPSDGPTYVAADLERDSLPELLPAHGFEPSKTVFIVEGVTMYLERSAVVDLLTDLAALAVPGSRLAVNFTENVGGSVAPVSRVVTSAIRSVWRMRGEPTTRWVVLDELPGLLRSAGWAISELTPGPELAARYVQGTGLPLDGVSPGAVVASAVRPG